MRLLKFSRRSAETDPGLTDTLAALRERRAPIPGCHACSAARSPYAYLDDGNHYCVPCAQRLVLTMRMLPAGKRADDVTLEDVLPQRQLRRAR